MLQILRFNSHLYFGAAAFVAVAWVLMIAAGLNGLYRTIILGGSTLAIYWMLASLWASHLVYDRSDLYHWTWINTLLAAKPRRWINIHAGWDESSRALGILFGNGSGMIFDIFDPANMTERSIKKARRHAASHVRHARADFKALPVQDGEADAVFLIFAAHELRRPDARASFFAELRRVLGIGGQVILVEHLRDWKNFAVFGPGFLHFFSAREWRRVTHGAGLEVEREFGMTPFVRVFVLRRRS
jgi:ubiquinone/menaquinone biosynthesis C-methylase UbiE